MLSGAGVPTGLNAPFDMNQMAALVNMMGGNPMMMFMMMMMNQQFMAMMMQMQKGGTTFGEAAKAISKEEPKLTNFEKSLEIAIEEQRSNLEEIGVKEVKKLYNLLKEKQIEKVPDVQNIGYKFDLKDSQIFVANLKNHFNITKKNIVNYGNKEFNELYYFIQNRVVENISLKNESFIRNGVRTNAIYALVCDIILDTNEFKDLKKQFQDNPESFLAACHENSLKSQGVELSDDEDTSKFKEEKDKKLFIKLCNDYYESIENALKTSISENKLMRNTSIIRNKPVRKNKLINESEFLKSELKRLWKL
jgi:hypothetical protein